MTKTQGWVLIGLIVFGFICYMFTNYNTNQAIKNAAKGCIAQCLDTYASNGVVGNQATECADLCTTQRGLPPANLQITPNTK